MPIEDVYIPPQASRPKGKLSSRIKTRKRAVKSVSPMVNTITDDNTRQDMSDFIMHNGICHYWKAVEIPTVVHSSK